LNTRFASSTVSGSEVGAKVSESAWSTRQSIRYPASGSPL
jgi:hypothetical protein